MAAGGIAVAAFSWNEPFTAFFGLLPLLVWLGLARSPRSGLSTGVVLVALLAWFMVPRQLGFAGGWVPAAIEVYWLHTTAAAVVCAAGTLAGPAPRGAARLALLVFAGFVVTGGVLISELEAPPGDEGVVPGPPLRIAQSIDCGSGGCWRVLDATGDRAPEVLRERLASQGFTPAPQSEITRLPRFCRTTGLLVNHEVCADLRTTSPDTVHVEWYVN